MWCYMHSRSKYERVVLIVWLSGGEFKGFTAGRKPRVVKLTKTRPNTNILGEKATIIDYRLIREDFQEKKLWCGIVMNKIFSLHPIVKQSEYVSTG